MKIRELEAFIAEQLEGLPVVWGPDPFRIPDRRLTDIHPWIHGKKGDSEYNWQPVSRYSHDWQGMQRIVECMKERGSVFVFTVRREDIENGGEQASYLAVFRTSVDELDSLDPTDFSIGKTLPEAVLRAAVRAVQIESRIDDEK